MKEDNTLALTIRNARDAIGVGNTKFYQLINEGAFPVRMIGRRRVVLKADLQAFLNTLPVVQPKATAAA
jgi:excisionase family DNA binding protein